MLETYKVISIPWTSEVRQFIASRHYTGTTPTAVKFCFGLYESDGKLMVVITYSPFSRLQAATKYVGYLELSRLILEEGLPKNSASFLIGKSLRLLKKQSDFVQGVISYADPTQGHLGTVYKAANFKLQGQTKPSYHYVDSKQQRIHKKKIWNQAKALKITEKQLVISLGLNRIEELPKYRYVYPFKGRDKIYGHVYLLTNLKTKKVYVGCTSQGIQVRFKRHVYDARIGSQLPIHCAIAKYGANNFKVEEIANAPTLEKLKDLEAFWIAQYKAADPSFGYNLTEGYDEHTASIPDEIFEKAFLLRLDGVEYSAIAQELGVSKGYLYEVLFGIKRPHLKKKFEAKYGKLPLSRKFSKEEKLNFFNLYAFENKTPGEIASLYKTSATFVRGVLSATISPEIKKIWCKNNDASLLNKELPTDQILKDYFNKVDLETLLKKYNFPSADALRSFVSRNNPTEQTRTPENKYSDELLLKAFDMKETGLKTPDIAEALGISTPYLNAVFRGEQRPHLNRPKPKPYTKKANQIKIECVGVGVFDSIKAAADFAKVSSTALLKAIKNDKTCKGFKFKKLT